MGSIITIGLLGELVVERDGDAVSLPPSKKTRALLGYLALTGREHRRTQLCSLLWEGASDPRGSLRWSLSRIRAVVDDETKRLRASRESVTLNPGTCVVDVLAVRDGLDAGVEHLPTSQLETLANQHRGELLEGLELGDQHAFAAWLVAEREEARGRHVRLLNALCERLASDPASALVHARILAKIDPLDASTHARVVRLLVAARRWREAQQEVESTRQMFRSLRRGAPREVETVWREAQALRTSEPRRATPPPDPAQASRPTSADPPLVGRGRECARLAAALMAVRERSRLRAVLLTGEPGFGKTRLLREFRDSARGQGVTVVRGQSYEAEETRAYGPWIDAIRRLPTDHVSQAERAALHLLLPELAGQAERRGSRDGLFAAVSKMLQRHARDAAPLVLLFDDVQWFDPASAMLLHYVARQLSEAPVLLLIAARPGEIPDNDALTTLLRGLRKDIGLEEIGLGALSTVDVVELVRALDPSVNAERIGAQAAGNPLFALELVRAFEDEADELPRGLAGIIRDRLDRLSSQARDAARWCSALGARIDLNLLETLVDTDANDFVEALEELERHGVLEPAPDASPTKAAYRFTHDLVRRAIYDELSAPRRRLMHGRAAEVLSAREDVDGTIATEVARQASLAGDAALAVRACLGAARRCLRMFANDEALALSRQGLHLVEELGDPVRTRLRIELHETQFGARRPEDTAPIIEELRALGRRALDLEMREHARLAFHLMSYLQWKTGSGNTRSTA